ncbi:MAG: hypothetical protein ABIP30_06970 [Ferruginibacter sp.]
MIRKNEGRSAVDYRLAAVPAVRSKPACPVDRAGTNAFAHCLTVLSTATRKPFSNKYLLNKENTKNHST